MEMKLIKDIEYRMCKELDDLQNKKDWTPADVVAIFHMTGSVKNLKKIEEHETEEMQGGYSGAGNWRANIEGDYGDRYSGARRRNRRGQYSGDGRDRSMMGNSYGGDNISTLEDMRRDEKDPRKREAIDRLIRDMMD